MSTIKFKCPECGYGLAIQFHQGLKESDGPEGIACDNCGKIIHRSDLVQLTREYAENLVRDMMDKPLY